MAMIYLSVVNTMCSCDNWCLCPECQCSLAGGTTLMTKMLAAHIKLDPYGEDLASIGWMVLFPPDYVGPLQTGRLRNLITTAQHRSLIGLDFSKVTGFSEQMFLKR